MKIQAKAGPQFAAYDDESAGEGLAIFLSQRAQDTVRWRIEVYAILNHAELLVGVFYTSPPLATNPNGSPTRMVAGAVCPGAISWKVMVSAAEGWQNAPQETADLTLASSRCCTAPIGVTRVGERYAFATGAGSGSTLTLKPGQTVKSLSAIATTGAASVQIGFTGGTIIIPNGVRVEFGPMPNLAPEALITFANVDWVVEFLESA